MERRAKNTHPAGKSLDLLVKRKIEAVELTPPPVKGWTRSKTWQVIKNKLEGSNKTIIAWGFSIAASVSMLIGAGLTLNDIHVFEDEEEITKTTMAKVPGFTIKKETPQSVVERDTNRELIILDNVPNKHPDQLKAVAVNTLPIRLTKFNATKKGYHFEHQPKNNPLFRPFVFMGHSLILGSAPGLGIDVRLKSYTRNNTRHEINLGVQSNFQQIVIEGSPRTYPFTFVQLGYSRTNDSNDKGWTAQAGMMVNPDSNVYQQKTVRFSLNRQFNRHIKAGPEFIFTDNFKKVYPGISIILS